VEDKVPSSPSLTSNVTVAFFCIALDRGIIIASRASRSSSRSMTSFHVLPLGLTHSDPFRHTLQDHELAARQRMKGMRRGPVEILYTAYPRSFSTQRRYKPGDGGTGFPPVQDSTSPGGPSLENPPTRSQSPELQTDTGVPPFKHDIARFLGSQRRRHVRLQSFELVFTQLDLARIVFLLHHSKPNQSPRLTFG
jgi:hypothetical protein